MWWSHCHLLPICLHWYWHFYRLSIPAWVVQEWCQWQVYQGWWPSTNHHSGRLCHTSQHRSRAPSNDHPSFFWPRMGRFAPCHPHKWAWLGPWPTGCCSRQRWPMVWCHQWPRGWLLHKSLWWVWKLLSLCYGAVNRPLAIYWWHPWLLAYAAQNQTMASDSPTMDDNANTMPCATPITTTPKEQDTRPWDPFLDGCLWT